MSGANKIKVFIAEDHPLMRLGLKTKLEEVPNIEAAGEASTGRETLELLPVLKPHILLLDINMPDMSGVAVAEIIKRTQPEIKIIVLTMYDTKNYVAEFMRLKVSGYLLKENCPAELIRAIETVYCNGTFYSERVNEISRELKSHIKHKKHPIPGILTPREEDVLTKLAAGKSNKEIARDLNLSVRTVETHRIHVSRKLKMRSLAELTKYAISKGLANIP